jgi:hypothetical protein
MTGMILLVLMSKFEVFLAFGLFYQKSFSNYIAKCDTGLYANENGNTLKHFGDVVCQNVPANTLQKSKQNKVAFPFVTEKIVVVRNDSPERFY